MIIIQKSLIWLTKMYVWKITFYSLKRKLSVLDHFYQTTEQICNKF